MRRSLTSTAKLTLNQLTTWQIKAKSLCLQSYRLVDLYILDGNFALLFVIMVPLYMKGCHTHVITRKLYATVIYRLLLMDYVGTFNVSRHAS